MAENQFTSAEHKRLEAIARRRGFQTAYDYMRALIEVDARQHGESAPFETSAEDAAEGFRIGWAQAQRGEILTEEEFWKAVADDD